MRERQKVRVTYTNHYTETPGRDTSSVTIEIKSKFIQVTTLLVLISGLAVFDILDLRL